MNLLADSVGKVYPTTLHNYIDVSAMSVKETVSYIPSDNESSCIQLPCRLRDDIEYLMI